MLDKIRIGMIVACHNRARVTYQWLNSLSQNLPANWELTLIATDDGSNDNTYEVLTSSELVTKVERGNGSWYWAKSMSHAEKILIENYKIDYIIWANDDTIYFKDSLRYVDKSRVENPDAILIGQFIDTASNQLSYGGMKKIGRHPFRYKLIETTYEFQECDVFNGNFVLIPVSAQRKIGGIDGKYQHGYADFDYSIRAERKNVKKIILHKPLGNCKKNLVDPTDFLTVKDRINFLRGRKGMPLKSHIRYLRKYGPIESPIYIFMPYARAIFKIKPKHKID